MDGGDSEQDSGSGSSLPTLVLVFSGICTLIAVLVSVMSIHLQLKNYRKPLLQRMVIRIMIMVPLYAISSLISLFSLNAAFVIDAIRDIYEAFVIYCFFELLLSYLGGERSLLILLHGRPPKDPVFPVSLFKSEIDVSDPHTFLFLKRGILQYVQVKPILAVATLILKACGKFNEGNFRANSGYLYVSIIYNTSICLSLYCLAVFWICVNDDLKPFRPVPKFLCVKGILFFSFWQSILISTLVAMGAIKKLGPYEDSEHISLGLTDTLICFEMPFFAIAHMYAFAYTDFIDPHHSYVARMPMYHAFRDAFGLLDVVEDSKATLRGEGMGYREFEPAEGYMHQGAGRERRIRAGLRYSKGGQRKYWLPQLAGGTQPAGRVERGVNRAITRATGEQDEAVHAPLLGTQTHSVVHLAPDILEQEDTSIWGEPREEEGDGYSLPFGDLDEGDEELFRHCKKYLFGDYNYPCIDVSSEHARTVMWDEEERVLRDERGAWFSPIRGSKGRLALDGRDGPAWSGYGAIGTTRPQNVDQLKLPAHRDGKIVEQSGDAIIDFEQDRTPAAESGDVQLKWTKIRGSRSASHSHSPRPQNRTDLHGEASSGPSSAESSSSAAGRHRASSSISRNNSGAKGQAASLGGQVLPPDAVDLVVEDNMAAQEERTRERRKGEPAVRGSGLKKVYKRGFFARDAKGKRIKGEVEVEDPEEENEVGEALGKRMHDDEGLLIAITDQDTPGEENANYSDADDSTTHDDSVIVRAETPPSHARIYMDSPMLDEENPWA